MSAHTPGPWHYDTTWGLIKHGGAEIAALHSGNIANARLIAAAPDLLAALQRLTHPAANDEDLEDALELLRVLRNPNEGAE
jgi:hypothetical protein